MKGVLKMRYVSGRRLQVASFTAEEIKNKTLQRGHQAKTTDGLKMLKMCKYSH